MAEKAWKGKSIVQEMQLKSVIHATKLHQCLPKRHVQQQDTAPRRPLLSTHWVGMHALTCSFFDKHKQLDRKSVKLLQCGCFAKLNVVLPASADTAS